MNPLVNKLALQAGAGWDYKYHWYVDSETLQKFALLVAKECAEVANCNAHVSGFTLGDLILEHWGPLGEP